MQFCCLKYVAQPQWKAHDNCRKFQAA